MSLNYKLLCLGLLIMFACPALASQTAIANVTDSSDVVITQKNYNGDGTTIVERASSTTYVNVEAPIADSVSVSMLGVGDVDTSRLIMKGEAIAFNFDPGAYKVTSGSPLVVYTIWSGNDVSLLQDSRSEMIYTKVYHRFDHQMISPAWIFGGYTNKCDVSIEDNTYLVIDNRDGENPFADNTMVNIRTIE